MSVGAQSTTLSWHIDPLTQVNIRYVQFAPPIIRPTVDFQIVETTLQIVAYFTLCDLAINLSSDVTN